MGQNTVKLNIDGYLLTFLINKYNKLQISASYIDQYGDFISQYLLESKYNQLPREIKQQFSSHQKFIKQIQKQQALCCTVRTSPYSFRFKEGKFIINKKQKIMKIQLKKVGQKLQKQNNQSQKISLQSRLQNQIKFSNPKQNNYQISTFQPSNIQNNSLTNFLILSKNGLILNLNQQNIKLYSKKNFENIDTKYVSELDLIQSNLTSNDLKQILSYNWTNLENLYLDKNKIDTIQGISKLLSLENLCISENCLGLGSAEYLIINKWPMLKYLKISFNQSQHTDCYLKLAQSRLKSFPKLERFTIVSNIQVDNKIKTKFKEWQTEGNKREVLYLKNNLGKKTIIENK